VLCVNANNPALRLLVLTAIVIAVPAPTALCQDERASADPVEIVQQFKTVLDANDVTSMCRLMTESDHSSPLSRLHFESMQSSMNELVTLWRYAPFAYGQMTINSNKTPSNATVWVSVGQLKQDVRFTLLKFPAGWFIADIEIYFR
jgi:hypothetical protein